MRIPDHTLDFVFIDADHTYEGVCADIKAWWSKVKQGGALCGHDAAHPNFPGVSKALDDIFTPDGWELFDDHVWRVWIK
jgi:predicted O-methyltransferase YrrM